MKIMRLCPGSFRGYNDWSLGLFCKEGDVSEGQCPVCENPVGMVADTAHLKWIVVEHAEIVEGEPVKEADHAL